MPDLSDDEQSGARQRLERIESRSEAISNEAGETIDRLEGEARRNDLALKVALGIHRRVTRMEPIAYEVVEILASDDL